MLATRAATPLSAAETARGGAGYTGEELDMLALFCTAVKLLFVQGATQRARSLLPVIGVCVCSLAQCARVC
jgi:hypothetical protein